MKRKIVAPVLILLAVLLTGLLLRASGVKSRLGAWMALEQLLEKDNALFQMELDTGGQSIQALGFWDRLDGDPLLGLTLGEDSIYLWEECLYLDNGRGFDLSGLLPEELEDWERYLPLMLLAEVQESASGESSEYRLTLTDKQLNRIQEYRPEWNSLSELLQDISLTITASEGTVQHLELSGSFGTLRAELLPDAPPAMDPSLVMQMAARQTISAEEILPLVQGCAALACCDTVGAWAELELSCGLLPIRDRAELYHSDGKLILVRGSNGTSLSLPDIWQGKGLFPALGYLMARDGTITASAEGAEYRLTVPAHRIRDLFDQLLPEASGLGIQFTEAEISVQVSGSRIQRLRLACGGNMPFLIAEIPIGFSMDLTMMEHPAVLPESARKALSRGETAQAFAGNFGI